MSYKIQYIDNDIDLKDFDCNVKSINDFLKIEGYYQHIEKRNRTKLVLDKNNNVIAFYTLTFEIISVIEEMDIVKTPVLEVKYLAVDKNYQVKKIGTSILMKIIAELEVQSEIIGGCGIYIRALLDKKQWYLDRGFTEIEVHNYDDEYTVPLYWNLRNEELLDAYFDEEE